MRAAMVAIAAAVAVLGFPAVATTATVTDQDGTFNAAVALDLSQVEDGGVALPPTLDPTVGPAEDGMWPAEDVQDENGTWHRDCWVLPEDEEHDLPAVIACADGWTETS